MERRRIEPTRLPALELRRRLGGILQKVAANRARYIVEKGGVPVAVVLNVRDYEDMLEALEVLEEQSDDALQAQMREGLQEYREGKARPAHEFLDSLE